MNRIIALAWMIVMMAGGMLSAQDQVMNEFQYYCYCDVREPGPEFILGLDNNAEIVLNLVKGRTRTEIDLKTGKITDSQLLLLKEWSLVEQRETKFFTAFPVIKDKETRELRMTAKEIAMKVMQSGMPLFKSLQESLTAMKHQKTLFSLLSAYVLDDLVIRVFDSAGVITRPVIVGGNVHWAGEFWAVRPRRIFQCESRNYATGGLEMRMLYREGSRVILQDLLNEKRNILLALGEIGQGGVIRSRELQETFEKFRMVDDRGRLLIPLIEEGGDQLLWRHCSSLASEISKVILREAALQTMADRYYLRDQKQALVILYEEVKWELLDLLHKEKLAVKPLLMVNPGRAEADDIGQLLFLVKKPQA
ncbi:MAG TPA: hypothetical protein P5531_03210 [Bacteroidales bacterium]|nr:hypothetical protein [Bacteroidales bacterium]HSA42472.1 hypothetical protein [Bacteroidales bacterium]